MVRLIPVVLAALLLSACAALPGDQSPQQVAARDLPPGAVVHYVRLKSTLPEDDVIAIMRRRAERFREVPGLLQKIYGRDAQTGEYCGIYIFESHAALESFRQSELALTIRNAYQVESARIERYDALFTLFPGVRAQ